MDAVGRLGFPAVVTFLLIWKVDKWAALLVEELREFRSTMERTTQSIESHVSERTEHTIHAITHDTRAALGNILGPVKPKP
jgi:hypothetical protein